MPDHSNSGATESSGYLRGGYNDFLWSTVGSEASSDFAAFHGHEAAADRHWQQKKDAHLSCISSDAAIQNDLSHGHHQGNEQGGQQAGVPGDDTSQDWKHSEWRQDGERVQLGFFIQHSCLSKEDKCRSRCHSPAL